MVRLVGRVGQRLLWLGNEGLVAAAGVLLGAEELVLCERDKVIFHVLGGPVRGRLVVSTVTDRGTCSVKP
jgi:hypothetical protein